MKTRIKKWGNSLGLRIPAIFIKELNITVDSEIELVNNNGQLIVKPIRSSKYNLGDLLAGITEDNLHSETDTGTTIGKEIW